MESSAGKMEKIKKHNTRSELECPIFQSQPKEFGEAVLPTYAGVMGHYLWIQHLLKTERNGQQPSVGEISEIVIDKLVHLWQKASIPVLSHSGIVKKIKEYNEKYRNLKKSYQSRKDVSSYKTILQKFRSEANNLFDIAACKCVFPACNCEKSKRVPVKEQEFLFDQRTTRKMAIGSVDLLTTKGFQKKIARKIAESSRREAKEHSDVSFGAQENEGTSSSEEIDDSNQDQFQSDFKCIEPKPSTSKGQMRVSLPTLAGMFDRYGISDRAAAAIASSVLEDVGIINSTDTTHVIDKSKVRRERQKERTRLQTESDIELHGLYFDGRKDKTLILEKEREESQSHRRCIVEEHVALVQQPESKYIGHVTPQSGSAASIKSSIKSFLVENSIKMDKLVAIGCDGTNTNTGIRGGIIRLLEEDLGRPLQWFVCQLHTNELPLRHLIVHLNGHTKSPDSLSGPIGASLSKCELLPVVTFQQIETFVPLVLDKDLSTDQRYLLQMCQAISSGHCTPDLSKRDPGKLSHARWLTTANRILRLYIGTVDPSENLIILVTFILKVYTRLWFTIKTKPSCKDGGKHVWEMVYHSRYLDEKLKEIVDTAIQRNAYFAHPENLLLSMLTDERANIRELAVRRILKGRKMRKDKEVRRFVVPKLNFDAGEYYELIQWQDITDTDPPILRHITDEDLEAFVKTKASTSTTTSINFENFSCHTQSVERTVKVITEAASAVCGVESRDGFIRARLQSRATMPELEKKSDYKAHVSL